MSPDASFKFTFETIKKYFASVLDRGYKIVNCSGYVDLKKGRLPEKTFVTRVDLDISCKKARRLAEVFNELGIKSTFFVRLHGDEYNPFSFENYRCLKFIRDSGHEIGYHSEVVDVATIWNEDQEACLKRDVSILSDMLNVEIKGVASHGGMTGLNNLDFWKDRTPADFGLLYEAYDKQPEFGLFDNSFYVSDSEWTRWKCYDNGVLRLGDRRTLEEHLDDNHPLIYCLVHPETYYDEHFYE